MADGKIIISTELDNSGIAKSADGLKQAIKRLTGAICGPFEASTSKAFQAAQQKVQETELAIRAVQGQMMALEDAAAGGGETTSHAFEAARQKVEENRIALGALNRQMEEIGAQKTREQGDFYTDPVELDAAAAAALATDKAYQKLGTQYDKLLVKHQQLTLRMEESKKAALAASGINSGEYRRLEKQLSSLTVKLAQYRSRMDQAAESAGQAGKAAGKAEGGMKKMLGVSGPLTKSLFKVSSMLKLMALRMVLRQVLQAAIQGFQDLAKACPAFNKSMSGLSTAFLQLRNSIATAAAPALTALAPLITQVANAFSHAMAMVAGFTARLFGNAKTFKVAAKAAVDYAGGMDKAQGSLAGFDDLQVLDQGSAAGSGPDPSQMFEEVEIPGETIAYVDQLKNRLAPELEGLRRAFDKLKSAVGRLWNDTGLKNVLKVLGEAVLIAGIRLLTGAIEALTGIIDIVTGIVEVFVGLLTGDLARANEGARLIFEGLGEIIEGVFVAILGQEAVDAVKKFIAEWASNIASWWQDNVAPWFTRERWLQLWEDVKAWWTQGWTKIKTWWDSSTLVVWWRTDVAPWFTSARWGQLWTDVKTWWVQGWANIKAWWESSALVVWWRTDVAPWFTVARWMQLWSDVKSAWVNKWNEIKTWWANTIAAWWKENVSPWFTAQKWMDMMKGVKDAFVSTFRNAVNAGIELFNTFIDWINSKMHFEWDAIRVAGKTIVPAGSVQLFTIPKIPRLAQGAVIPPNREFLAVLGDQKHGTNIEAPLDTLVEAFRQVQGEGGQVVQLNFGGDLASLARALKPALDQESRRKGARLVIG